MPPKLILITGASSDIGLALSRHLLETQDCTLLAHSFSGGERISALHAEFGERVVPLQANLTSPDAVASLLTAVLQHGVPTSVVHMPALRLQYHRFTKAAWDRFEQDMAVQLRSAVTLLQSLLPKMAKLPRARVVFVLSSVVHGIPPKYMSLYTVLKYAQLGLMRALAAEYAATPVRVNAVSPSMVETQFLQEIGDLAVRMSADSSPLKRNALPTDLLGAFDLLLSDSADYMTGVDIPVTGGTA